MLLRTISTAARALRVASRRPLNVQFSRPALFDAPVTQWAAPSQTYTRFFGTGTIESAVEQLDESVRSKDWKTGWSAWESIQAGKGPLPDHVWQPVMTNVFRLCYFDHEHYFSSRDRLEGHSDHVAKEDWVATAVHVIHDAVDGGIVTDDKDTLETCFTRLLSVAERHEDIEAAEEITDAISSHGLPTSIAMQLVMQLYREIYHTRSV